MGKKLTTRERLIDAIVQYSGDELDETDYITIAAESEDELIERVINILSYYYNEYNQ